MKTFTSSNNPVVLFSITLIKAGIALALISLSVQAHAQTNDHAMAMNTETMRGAPATHTSTTATLPAISNELPELGLEVKLDRSTNTLNMTWKNSHPKLTFRILNEEGKVLRDRAAWQSQDMVIDLSDLPQQMYTLQVIELRTVNTQVYHIRP